MNILFNTTPPGSIILMEDIDVAFPSASKKEDHEGVDPPISFGDILNVLDGISSQEGNIVFMTTNRVSYQY